MPEGAKCPRLRPKGEVPISRLLFQVCHLQFVIAVRVQFVIAVRVHASAAFSFRLMP